MRFRLAALAAFFALCAPAHANVALHRCGGALCGSLKRPLDPGLPEPGSRVEYRGIHAPLLRERDLLLVDNRGTGTSGLIDCENLQTFEGRTSGSAFAKRVGACAKRIDRRFGAHATDLFATAYAADDLAGASCGRQVIRSFVRGALDASCAGRIPALHTPDFQATDPAGVAANAFADAAIRSFYSEDRRGLRGGRFTVSGNRISLRGVVFAPGTRVDGSGTFDYAKGAYSGTFTVNGKTVRVAWTQATPLASAAVDGAAVSVPAP